MGRDLVYACPTPVTVRIAPQSGSVQARWDNPKLCDRLLFWPLHNLHLKLLNLVSQCVIEPTSSERLQICQRDGTELTWTALSFRKPGLLGCVCI